MKCSKEQMTLYAVTDRRWLGEKTLYAAVEECLKGGATFVQLREKELDRTRFLAEAAALKALVRKYGVPFVINDDVEIALACGADGVHVGQEDMESSAARAALGRDKILGVSVHSVEEALKAQACGADYLGAGAVFSTGTKENASCLSCETLKAICDAVSIPVVAIGGINGENIARLRGTGIGGVAVVSALFAQKDIEDAARKLKNLSQEVFCNV
ncbi:MAG: thiamine phosphate synthase [Pyramidobacter sp.]|nr:thiamine phosphate synthase [Pyramidobacter sp.]